MRKLRKREKGSKASELRKPRQGSRSHPPQGDGYLGEPCATLQLLVGELLHNVCTEIDSRFVDLPTRKQKKYQSSRALLYNKLLKLQGFVKQIHESGDLIIEAMQEKLTKDGLIIKESVKV